ncbi:MAG: conjugal transfer protein TraB [Myxococcales bacterium]|nr:conjugal transfer protein TraB [Myxococcales bacterium]
MELGPNVTVLQDDDCTTYLVGTAHISEKSVREVRETIEAVRPDSVCVELCKTRYQAILDENRWKKLDIFQILKQKKVLFVLANLALAAYQRRLGEKLGVKPGAELKEAIDAANDMGSEIVLVDRDIQATLKRTWSNLSLWNRLKLISGLFGGAGEEEEITEEELEKLKDRDNISEMMKEFAKELPQIKEPLIDERDQFLISAIEDAPGSVKVAVVGAGHVEGMIANRGVGADRNALSVIPPRSVWVPLLKWLIPSLILIAFYWGYQNKPEGTLAQLIQAWVIPNAIGAAVLTAIAGAKPLSVIVATIASPITSLNPTIGAGMVVGLVEAWLRKPTVEDAEKLGTDVTTLRGMYRNPFSRVLIVATLATLGSALGAWIGMSLVFTHL